jgi:hypothetical protein
MNKTMMKHKEIIVLIVMLFVVLACQSDDINHDEDYSDYILFGHFFGECGGEECIEIFKMTDNSIYEDILDWYPGSVKPYDGIYKLLNQSLFEKVKDLKAKIPADLLIEEDVVIGQPDAGDWGGIYFEIADKGIRRFWLIDKNQSNLPGYLIPFVTEIEAKIYRINN